LFFLLLRFRALKFGSGTNFSFAVKLENICPRTSTSATTFLTVHGPGQIHGTTQVEKMISNERLYDSLDSNRERVASSTFCAFFFPKNIIDMEERLH